MVLEEITANIDPEEGWNDIFLRIVYEQELENSFVYIGKGLYNGKTVGLKVEIKKGIVAGLLASGEINKAAFYENGIQFSSIGLESNELVKALSELYNFPTTKQFSNFAISSTIFSLNEVNVDLSKRNYYKFKLFFHENSEDLYSEMFCNINLTKGIIELHEKDEEYRENIIKVLSN